MELTITNTIYIDIEEILAIYEDGRNEKDDYSLNEAINDYVGGLDDYYYYQIGDDEIEQIGDFIEKNYLTE